MFPPACCHACSCMGEYIAVQDHKGISTILQGPSGLQLQHAARYEPGSGAAESRERSRRSSLKDVASE